MLPQKEYVSSLILIRDKISGLTGHTLRHVLHLSNPAITMHNSGRNPRFIKSIGSLEIMQHLTFAFLALAGTVWSWPAQSINLTVTSEPPVVSAVELRRHHARTDVIYARWTIWYELSNMDYPIYAKWRGGWWRIELPFLAKTCDLFVYLNLHFGSFQFEEVISTFVANIHHQHCISKRGNFQGTVQAFSNAHANCAGQYAGILRSPLDASERALIMLGMNYSRCKWLPAVTAISSVKSWIIIKEMEG